MYKFVRSYVFNLLLEMLYICMKVFHYSVISVDLSQNRNFVSKVTIHSDSKFR